MTKKRMKGIRNELLRLKGLETMLKRREWDGLNICKGERSGYI